ncbi:MAG: alpha/beta fold hydrolase [Proteobacteria bacterium]|jgi:3-oxoadipate enol-lactonase|nr:alpha/beta fold hydrolase [Pseudomonadota bacterium]MDA1136040.1 alpha/beta fold hydrolase [Pseudomonadota bacterium]
MKSVPIENGNHLKINIDGNVNNPKIIFSNSLGTDVRMWETQINILKENFCIVRYDTRGHGDSSPVEGPYSFEILENDVITIMDNLNIDKAHFIGLSIGGMTSLGLSLKYPNRFNKIICCAARADNPPPYIESWNQRISVIEEKGTAGVVEGSIDRWYSEEFRTDHNNNNIINLSKEMIKNTSSNGYIGCAHALKTLNYLKDLSTINKDMLYIAGEKDMGAPALAMEEMSHLTANSKYVCIPGAAHILNIEASDIFNKTILEFLN